MSRKLDPTWISTFNVEEAELIYRLNTITDLKATDPFVFGMRVYNRSRPPPVV